MKQEDRDKVFQYQIKQMIADYGGRENLAKVITLENPEAFDYIEYNEAKADEKAKEIFNKKGIRNKTNERVKAKTWGPDHVELFTAMPESITKALPSDTAYYRRKQLNLPVRKYQKSA